LPPQPLSSGKNVFDALGKGFTLLALGVPNADVDAFTRAASSARLPLTVIQDSFDGGREAYGHRLVLVRPDQYVAWAGDAAPRDVSALLEKVTGRTNTSG
jgi:hypothetical protein